MEQVIDNVKNIQWQKYTDNFNFFQSKHLTLILTNRKV